MDETYITNAKYYLDLPLPRDQMNHHTLETPRSSNKEKENLYSKEYEKFKDKVYILVFRTSDHILVPFLEANIVWYGPHSGNLKFSSITS